ncbi:MAG TPA: hypothetical protein PLY26_13465, partial [Ferruginibacter sp.]|nr:hypothetical protein [Ferruginibacter sp.]
MLKLTPFLLLCTLITCRAEAQQRKYVNDYLNIGVGGRGLGMSGAQSSTVSDVTSPFWNPAGIAG